MFFPRSSHKKWAISARKKAIFALKGTFRAPVANDN